MSDSNAYTRLASINVNDHVEKKNGLSYLSWAWAVDQLLRLHPEAQWAFRWFGDKPYLEDAHGVMVFCTVTIGETARTAFLPVMDNRNNAIPQPDMRDINDTMQRCLVKAIAHHGLGLYIYAGEDLPAEDRPANEPGVPAPVAPIKPKSDELLTPAQKRYIERLMVETGVTLERFRKFFGFESPDAVTKSDASRVIKALEGARRKEAA